MDSDASHEGSVSVDHVDYQGEDVGKCSDRVSLSGEVIGEMGNSVEILTQLERDLACVSEKIVNLNVLMMHVGTRENEFEALASEREHARDDSLEKALEFDFLSGVLDLEVRELDGFMAALKSEVVNARELVSSRSYEGETFREIVEKLRDSEQSFKQSQDQISEIRTQSAKLQRALSNFGQEENWNNDKRLDEDQIFNMNVKMQTAEQQRHILRMLEKSLAREIDLEKKLTELRQVDEELKQRLHGSEQEVYCMEDETADVLERWFEADNIGVVLMGISKELLGRLQILKFNLSSSVQRETQLRSKLEGSIEELKAKENSLRDLDIQLQRAIASAEASQEKQNLLYCTICDMENLIDNLKLNVSKYERRADSAEEKCIVLSGSHAELNEELNFLRGRLESLELSLQQADEAKRVAAKGIGFQSKVVTNLVMQLAFERDRLHKQISALAKENKLLVQKLQENSRDQSAVTKHDRKGNNEEYMAPKHESVTATYSGDNREEVTETSAISSKLLKTREDVSIGETEVASMPGPETVRRIDAGVLSFKHIFLAMLILLIAVGAYYSFQLERCPF